MSASVETTTISQTTTELPKKYQVVYFNDERTTFEFVIYSLTALFRKTEEEAARITMAVHREGSAVVGVYTREIATELAKDAVALARANHYPLRVEARPE